MGVVRTSLFIFVVLLHLQHAITKPFLEPLICDFFCTEDDNTTTTIASNQQDIFDMLCEDCTPRRPSTSTQPPVNLIIPPMNGMNLTMVNQGGNWMFNMIPWGNNNNNNNNNNGAQNPSVPNIPNAPTSVPNPNMPNVPNIPNVPMIIPAQIPNLG